MIRKGITWWIALFSLGYSAFALGNCKTSSRALVLSENQIKEDLQRLYDAVMSPVLGEGNRERLTKIELDPKHRRVVVRAAGETVVATLTDSTEDPRNTIGPPVTDRKRSGNHVEIFLPRQIFEDPRALQDAQGFFRSALVAGHLHPHQMAPDQPSNHPVIPSYLERDANQSLMKMAIESMKKHANKPTKVGEMDPTGTGKSIVVMNYVRSMGEYQRDTKANGWKKPPKILNIVNSIDLLDQNANTAARELGMTRFSKIYGDHLPAKIDHKAQFVGVTPESFLNRLSEFQKLLTEDPDQPWIIHLDEAHHTETPNGRFQDIRQFVDDKLDERHHVVLTSAFFGYRDGKLFIDFLEGNVHGTHLTEQELEKLRRGEDLAQICRAQYVRTVMDGYIPPVLKLDVIDIKNYKEVLSGTEVDGNHLNVRVYKALLDDMAKRIDEDQIPGVVQRGIVYVDLTARANFLAKELQKRLGFEVRAYHSGEESSPDALDWISDKGKYDTAKDRRTRKFIVLVDKAGEGQDIRGINTIVFARNYSNTYAGFSHLMQNNGRSSRVHAADGQFKPGTVLIDYSGSGMLFQDGLSSIIADSRRDGTKPIRITRDHHIVVETDPISFEARRYELIPEIRDQFVFEQNFPFFDFDVFADEAYPVIYEAAKSLGLKSWSQDPMVTKKLALLLAERLPKGMPGRKELLDRLQDDKYWGWKDRDAWQAKRSPRAAQRIFRAIYEVAALYRMLPEGRSLDLSRLHTGGGMKEFFDRFLPGIRRSDYAPLSTQEEKTVGKGLTFLQEQGANYGIKPFSDGGLTDILLRALSTASASPKRDALVKELEEGGLKPGDGNEAKTGYLAARRVNSYVNRTAEILNEGSKDPIDIDHLFEPDQLRKVLARLDPDPVRSLATNEERKAFFEGAWTLMAQEALERDLPKVSDKGGLAFLLEDLAKSETIPKDKKKDLLARLKNDLATEPYDGRSLNNKTYRENQTHMEDNIHLTGALQRAYRSLYAIAQVMKKTPAGKDLNLERLYERAEMEKLLNALRPNRVGKNLDSKSIETFIDPKRGSLYFIVDRARDFSGTPFTVKDGARDFLERLAGEIKSTTDRSNRIREIRALNWGPTRGGQITKGYPDNTNEFYLELGRTLSIIQKERPNLHIDLDAMYRLDEFSRVFDSVLSGFDVKIPIPSDSELNKMTCFSVLEDRASEFGVSGYSHNYGPKRMIENWAQKLIDKHPKEAFLKTMKKNLLESWGWSQYDADMIKHNKRGNSREVTYRALYVIASAVNKVEGRKVINLSKLGNEGEKLVNYFSRLDGDDGR